MNTIIPIIGVGSVSSGKTTGVVEIQLQSTHSQDQVSIQAHILPKLTVELPALKVQPQNLPHLKDLILADPEYFSPSKIDILIGADTYGRILKPGVRLTTSEEPSAIQTMFGWTILGPADKSRQCTTSHVGHLMSHEELHQSISKFWEMEEVPLAPTESLTAAEAECEDHFVRSHSRDSSGRYIVRLPFKSNAPALGRSKLTALSQLSRQLKRLNKLPELHQKYKDFLTEYEDLQHMRKITDSNTNGEGYYLPHHGVLRNDKIRVVFNGSSRTSTGISLNDTLHAGPKTQNDIFDVLLYIRFFQFIFTTDIVKMFRQILVHTDDQKFQRIVWAEEHNQDPATYELLTVTYGSTSAPYLAGRCMQQLVIDEGHQYPLAIEPFKKGSYVDDISGGADTLAELIVIASQVEDMCKRGCFPLAKWKSNHSQFIKLDSPLLHDDDSHEFNQSAAKILGLAWKCAPDLLTFTGHTSISSLITKRSILSETAQLFDPLGLISPVVVKAKILMQDLWMEKVGWDDTLSPQLVHRWKTFRSELPELSLIEIPRWLNTASDKSSVEIHGFSDASQAAMAAAVFIRVAQPHKSAKVTLACAKTRVSPLQRLTIPRLELSAALLLTKLVARVQQSLELQDAPVTLWSDSSVTLAWINSEPSRWKEFVKNRVQDIHSICPSANWNFISGKENPADCASRGLSPSQLKSHKLWWTGPDWLARDPHQWPSFTPAEDPSTDSELRPTAIHIVSAPPQLPLDCILTKCNTLTKLLRVTATILRAVAVFKRVPASKLSDTPLNPCDLQLALTHWIKETQQAYFKSELRIISQGKQLAKSHALTRLTARLDVTGLLRVGGRLQNSQLEEDSKHPPILPRHCALSSLIIANAHARTLHGGTQLTLSYIRRYCWIIGGRAPIKSFIQRCITCTRIRAVRAQQLMGQLPPARVTPSLVFENTGVDYAGPVQLKFFQGRGTRTYKAWIAVFVCLSTSAVHLEAVTDYSSEGFLKAFRRFTSRRGIPRTLVSDCGTNFKGADLILRRLLHGSLKESLKLQQLLTNDGTRWYFNPPGAPHMGGKWEAAVKSVKSHLQKTIAETTFTYEDFSTFLTQVEAVLNSRPICALTEDPEDLAPLTAGHFIRGAPLNTIPEPTLTDVPWNRLSHFQKIQERFQTFWQRWSNEYLHDHQSISKWHTSYNDIQVGSIVLISDQRYPPSKWPLARVVETHPGKDGLTRVVTLKTATTTLQRPISALVLLPTSQSEEILSGSSSS